MRFTINLYFLIKKKVRMCFKSEFGLLAATRGDRPKNKFFISKQMVYKTDVRKVCSALHCSLQINQIHISIAISGTYLFSRVNGLQDIFYVYSSGPNNGVVLNCVGWIFSSPFIGENACLRENSKSY